MGIVYNERSSEILSPQPIRAIELPSEDSVLNPANVLELIQRPKTPAPGVLGCPLSNRFSRPLEPILEGKEQE